MWTSPLAFNDPFDAQFDCGFPFSFEDFAPVFLNAITELVFQDTEPSGDLNHPLFQKIMIARRSRHTSSRKHFQKFFAPTVAECIPNLNDAQIIATSVWKEVFKGRARDRPVQHLMF